MKPNYLKFFLYLAIALVVAGCGGGSNRTNPITVAITGAPSTVTVGTTANLGVTVTNDSKNAGVTWGVTGAGTFTSTTTSLTYTAPPTVPDSAMVTVTATSITDITKSNSVTFTIVAAGTVTVTITNPIGTIAPGSAAVTVNATVANDGTTNPGVAWTLVTTGTTTDCQPACGTITNPTTTSVLYTPPATVPSPATASLIATSNTDMTQSATDNITIANAVAATCGTPSVRRGKEAFLTMPYAFLLKGQDADGDQPVDYVGSFTPDGNGDLTHADLDINGFSTGSIQTSIDLDNSGYTYGGDGRGCLYLSFTEVSPTVKPVKASAFRAHAKHSRKFAAQRKPRREAVEEEQVIFAFAIIHNSATGRIQEFDNLTGDGFFAAGQLHQQTPGAFSLAGLSPNFAFGIDGWATDVESGIDRSAIAGSFANSNGTLSSLTADENIAGDVSGEQTGGSGTLNNDISSTTGRGTGSLTINTDEGVLTFDFVYYIVNDADVFVMSSDDTQEGSETLFAGRALSTGTNSGTPSGNFISALTGLDCTSCSPTNPGNNVVQLATLNVTGAAAASGITYVNDAGTFTTTPFTGTFALEQATQRGQVTGGTTVNPPVAYFTNTASEDQIVAFLVGTDDFGSGGFVLFQTKSTPAYTAADVTGNYAEGTAEDISGLNGSETGVWNFDGVSAYTNILDLVQTGGTSTTPFMLSGSYSLSANGDGSGTYTGTAGTTIAFVTSGDAILSTEESSIQPQLHVFIQQPEE